MKKFVTLILVSFTLLFCFSFAVFAAEREATGEEISAVKSGQSLAYRWEDSENHWKLLYLDAKGKMWRYAKNLGSMPRTVGFKSGIGFIFLMRMEMQWKAGFRMRANGTLQSMTI